MKTMLGMLASSLSFWSKPDMMFCSVYSHLFEVFPFLKPKPKREKKCKKKTKTVWNLAGCEWPKAPLLAARPDAGYTYPLLFLFEQTQLLTPLTTRGKPWRLHVLVSPKFVQRAKGARTHESESPTLLGPPLTTWPWGCPDPHQ